MAGWAAELLPRQGIVACLLVIAFLSAAVLVAYGGRRRIRSSKALFGAPGESGPEPRRHPPGHVWTWGKTTSVREDGLRDTAMILELIAAMLDAGSGIGRSLELITACAAPSVGSSLRPVVAALAVGTDWETAWRSSKGLSDDVLRLKDALSFAALTGAPTASILYAQAVRERRQRFREAEQRAAALGVKLVVPLGLCSLPAFICLGVIPVLLAMLPPG